MEYNLCIRNRNKRQKRETETRDRNRRDTQRGREEIVEKRKEIPEKE